MRRSRICLLFLVFVALGAYVYFFEVDRTTQRDTMARGPVVDKVIDFNPQDVEEIVLNVKTRHHMIFKKEDGVWRVKEPVQADASADRINYALEVFSYGIIREVSTDPFDLPLYGLDHPAIELGIRLKGEKTFKTLQLGANSPTEASCYGKLSDQPRILLLGIRYKLDIDKEASWWIAPDP